MTTKQNSIVNSKLLKEFTLEYLKEHEGLINLVKKETEKQLRLGVDSISLRDKFAMEAMSGELSSQDRYNKIKGIIGDRVNKLHITTSTVGDIE